MVASKYLEQKTTTLCRFHDLQIYVLLLGSLSYNVTLNSYFLDALYLESDL